MTQAERAAIWIAIAILGLGTLIENGDWLLPVLFL
jgi:hypothetical protein